jgi:hypothetical protein
VEDVTAENRSILRRATIIFDLVRGDALPRTASRALILETAEKWKTINTGWRKSSYSGNGGSDCVEAGNPGHDIAVRDSKDQDGPRLAIPASQWRAFIGRVQQGR